MASQLSDEQLVPYHDDEYMLRVARDLLDQQIIDVNGRKVVRVTDLTLEIERAEARDLVSVLEVDVGLRSILRRLFQGALPPRSIRSLQYPFRPIPSGGIFAAWSSPIRCDACA